mgnify:FL=1
MDEFANVSLPDDLNLFESAYREVCEKIRIELLEPPKARRATTQASLGVGVNAAKAEKSDGMVYGQTLCTVFNGQPAAKPVRESSTAIRYGVGPRGPKRCAPAPWRGEDIVYACVKAQEA